jgi:hypothetical protein
MSERSGWITAGIVAAVIAAITIIAVIVGSPAGSTSSNEANSAQAKQKAAQLNSALVKAGLPAVSSITVTRLYGTDGGISCQSAGHLQDELGLNSYGNASLNQRRIALDPSVVAYDRTVIATYCPNRLPAYDEKIKKVTQAKTISQ